ncbi:MAG: hypothetical protein AAGF95_01340 [Chloroflexota bacterium]
MARKSPANEKMWQRSSTRIRFTDKDMNFSCVVPLAFGSELGVPLAKVSLLLHMLKKVIQPSGCKNGRPMQNACNQ